MLLHVAFISVCYRGPADFPLEWPYAISVMCGDWIDVVLIPLLLFLVLYPQTGWDSLFL